MPVKKTELSQADLDMRAKVLSDLEGGEHFGTVINRDAEYDYALAAKDPKHPTSANRLKQIGYEVVDQNNNSGEELPAGVNVRPDSGAVQGPDTVLMRIRKEYREMRQEKKAEIARAAAAAQDMEFQEKLESTEGVRRGARTFMITNNPLSRG